MRQFQGERRPLRCLPCLNNALDNTAKNNIPFDPAVPEESQGLARRRVMDRPSFCLETPAPSAPYFLALHVYVRLYAKDDAELGIKELLHWLTYQRYAGVEHVYLYDCYLSEEEKLDKALASAIQSNYVTYMDWSQAAQSLGKGQSHMHVVQVGLASCLQEGKGVFTRHRLLVDTLAEGLCTTVRHGNDVAWLV